MNAEKIKRKIAEGHKDETIAVMAGITAEEVAKYRKPSKPEPKKKPTPKKQSAPSSKKT
jgi:hypothetical protein